MSVELIIKSSQNEVTIAILHSGKLVELHKEKSNNNFSVGDIYLGKVKKIMPGLNATFVNVGYERDAFLHYLDLGAKFKSFNKYTKGVTGGKFNRPDLDFKLEPEIEKTGKIEETLKSNQNVLVQISKEPISTKGPRLSSEISLAGRYLVLVPFSDKVSVSQKIKNTTEKDRLRVFKRVRRETAGQFAATFPISLLQALEAGDNFDLWDASGAGPFVEHLIQAIDTLSKLAARSELPLYNIPDGTAVPALKVEAVLPRRVDRPLNKDAPKRERPKAAPSPITGTASS